MSEQPTVYRLIFDEPNKPFINHLNLPHNDRIIFSGAYGLGKSSFILDFFSDETQQANFGKKRYNPIYLKPVNYSVAANEDIFKYIKFDILVELIITHKVPLDNEEIIDEMLASTFIANNAADILAPLLVMIPFLGKDYYDIYKEFKTLHTQFLQFKAEQKTDQSHADEFLDSVFRQEGSIYESNIYTELIKRMLVKLKELTDPEIENILIIDDLDRIDPHHIFRLFNVFASHFDERVEKGNKFGFDKVMFVCDINNIEHIFRHIYGAGTDFNGYLDKFFSRHIHFFDNRKAVEAIIEDVVNGFVFDEPNSEELARNMFQRGGLGETLKYILRELVAHGRINLRALFRFSKEKVPLPVRSVPNLGRSDIYNIHVPIVLLVEALLRIFGDHHDLSQTLLSCRVEKASMGSWLDRNEFLGMMGVVLGYRTHKFMVDSKYHFIDSEAGVDFEGRLAYTRKPDGFYSAEFKLNQRYSGPQQHTFYFLSQVVQLLKEIGYLR
ncbi:P-loop NTPase fold protein [Sabulibacter ruber]|uniref:P-loop NTPase fold protein n=1 Tax=Sabulibacter ruber TaxID=2811901 RepID=UPI001A968EFC|nr:P-loop NTPase fold protein [Sabulibacter ruber]